MKEQQPKSAEQSIVGGTKEGFEVTRALFTPLVQNVLETGLIFAMSKIHRRLRK